MVADNTRLLAATESIREPHATEAEQHDDLHSTRAVNIDEETTRRLLPSVYFNDGRRLIDLVFVYRTGKRAKQNAEQHRIVFEAQMRAAGLELEHEAAEGDASTVYVKVHTSSTALKHRVCQKKQLFIQ
jgi:hypothetical protein